MAFMSEMFIYVFNVYVILQYLTFISQWGNLASILELLQVMSGVV